MRMSSKERYLEKGIIDASLLSVDYHPNSHMGIVIITESELDGRLLTQLKFGFDGNWTSIMQN